MRKQFNSGYYYMRESFGFIALGAANLGAWTINDLSMIEMSLKLVLLVLTIALTAKRLFGKAKERKDS